MVLVFDGVMASPEVYVNGTAVGSWTYGYNSFWLDVTEAVKPGALNVLAVHADTRKHNSRWYPGAGIYRKVALQTVDAVHVPVWGVSVTTPEVDESKARVRVVTSLTNNSAQAQSVGLATEVVDAAGRVVALQESRASLAAQGGVDLTQDLTVASPQRWDVAHPYLYTVRTRVSKGGAACDQVETPFGVRTFQWTVDDGFHLNGRRVQLNGVDLHHDQGALGAALYPRAIERQIQIMRDMGVNAIRTSHNPPAPELLDLCDRLGLVVFDEAFDKWDSTAGYRASTAEFVYKHAEKEVRNFILRDRNHPSVVIWSIGNEIGDILANRDGRSPELVGKMAEYFRRYDTTRPLTMAGHMTGAVSPGSHTLDAVDVMSWNYDRKYALARKRYPDKPAVYSESASAFSTRGFYELPLPGSKTQYSTGLKISSYDHTAAQWSDIPDVEFRYMLQDRYCAGEFVWTGFDYLGEPTPFDREARSSYFGIVDLAGLPKDRFYLYRSHWNTNAATVHLLPHWNWPERAGKPVPVYAYASGDEAELFLNGKSQGRRKLKPLAAAPSSQKTILSSAVVSVSSEESAKGNTGAMAVDGDGGTRWCASSGTVPQWWQADLGKATRLQLCTIDWERDAENYEYQLQVSDDGQAWRTAADHRTAGNQSIQASLGLDATARYVRVQVTALKGSAWASIREVRLNTAAQGVVENPYYRVMDSFRFRWMEVPWEPGELKVAVYQSGKAAGQASVRTAGAEARVRLTPDRARLKADGLDLSYLTVEMTDKEGVLCPLASARVQFKVEGPAEIVGVDNGDPVSLEPFVADYRKLFFGKAVVILRAKAGQPGSVRVSAAAGGVETAQCALETAR